nr:MAG TPA: hypothetical protein [Crassvirales sp.]
MERNITITLEKAKEWYNSDNISLKEIALQAFNKKELDTFDFTKIKTFEDALLCFYKFQSDEYYSTIESVCRLRIVSRASAAMFQLNIIRKALNLGQDLHLTKDPKDSYIYYPYNPFVTEGSTYYNSEFTSGKMEVIGKIKSEGTLYNVLGGYASYGDGVGLGAFSFSNGSGNANAYIGFLGCATREIAKHFGKYFGMLITEAKYGDLVDFEVIERKYQ